jgi:hypothetical protein
MNRLVFGLVDQLPPREGCPGAKDAQPDAQQGPKGRWLPSTAETRKTALTHAPAKP